MAKYDPTNNNRKMSEQDRRNDYRYDDYRRSDDRRGEYRRDDYRRGEPRRDDYRRSRQGRYPDSRYYDRRGYDMRHRGGGYYSQPVKKKRHVGLFIFLAIIIILLACVLYFGNKAKTQVNELKTQAYELKDELKETLDCVKSMDTDGAEDALAKVDVTRDGINKTLDEPLWKFVTLIPGYGDDVTSVKTLMSALDDASNDLFKPFINQIRDNPLSDLRATEKGLKISVILSYLDFLDETEPKIHDIAEKITSVKFQKIDMDLEEYSEKFTGLFASLDAIAEYKDLLRTFLGNGKDRLYLVMAQNSSEIRASGGFPGSMGVIRIEDGILSIGEFSSVTNFIHQPILPESNITERELQLYQGMYGNWAHDACYNPHFAKVAYITKVAYDYRNGESLDGILSMTPEIIQQILKITGDEITLEDGTMLDGTNATKVLQRDLYIKYQGENATAYANDDYVDNLFAETAKKAMGLMFKSFDIDNMPAYMNFIMDGCERRTMMLWFADEDEEQISIDSGCSGNLNSDPEKPATGVYFSCCDPGKLGMFVEINSAVSDAKTNANGEQEYTVTATFKDYINEEDLTGVNSTYILGNNGGAIQSYVYFFAPAGGKISDFEASNGMTIEMSEYEGLQVGYNLNLMLQPGEPVVVTYKVTTAKGVETPLRVESTPTLQDYR